MLKGSVKNGALFLWHIVIASVAWQSRAVLLAIATLRSQ